EVGGLTGSVTRMGARACTVRTFSGVEVLVPNSKFLENNVVNWTLSDQKMRFDVTVGVAYGSDTRRVKDILEEIAGRHGQILKDPDPVVVFQDFGDNALVFAVYFWLDLEKSDSRVVRSDIRFMIERAFAKENIAIAFPQRDVHMNMAGPVEVRLAREQDAGPAKD
ncbi:MAG TPA: mechanosensitive ion channel, partial [Candidatus Hydrogenedentes bacterium]|nr:mechanosensitive ion channel [Candidatus Hydrogenedentota bacterium]